MSDHSREYLEAFHEAAKKQLPPWQADWIHQEAMPRSGGRAGARTPQHSALESALIRNLLPEHLDGMIDGDLQRSWDELAGHHKLATKKNLPTEDYERAASFCIQEMKRRGMPIDEESDLAKASARFSTVAKRCEMLPEEIVIAKAAGLRAREDGYLDLVYDALLGDDGAVSSALANVGVFCKSSSIVDLETALGPEEQFKVLYDLILRRPGLALPTGEDELYLSAHPNGREPIAKAMKEKRLIWYITAEPGTPDSYGHIITAVEIEDAAHRFMLGPRKVFMEHGDLQGLNADGYWPAEITGKAYTVESGILPCPTNEWFGVETPRTVPARSWFTCNYYPDDRLWSYVSNTAHGNSWRGPAAKVVK